MIDRLPAGGSTWAGFLKYGSSLEMQKWGEQKDSKWKAPWTKSEKTTRTDGDETPTSVGEEAVSHEQMKLGVRWNGMNGRRTGGCLHWGSG